jgi:hypothetical protein
LVAGNYLGIEEETTVPLIQDFPTVLEPGNAILKKRKKERNRHKAIEKRIRDFCFVLFFFFYAVEFLGMSWVKPCMCQPC